MLPMQILYGAMDTPVSIELKTGECYNGYIQNADYFMNFQLRDVTITASDGNKFFHVSECFVRGNNVKYIRVVEDAIKKAAEQKKINKRTQPNFRGKIRGALRKK